MVYNHTVAPSTIAFKDAIVFADSNEYLKRYYFLRNALDKEEIYDRINLLAGTTFVKQSSTAMQCYFAMSTPSWSSPAPETSSRRG